ncbi:MAG: LysM peptidoglycan-binding domain-containing protein [Alicyclobacillaceae bacterium]|nr:LysM peptidoglycan-binding domain-containing protein [Alicyclobacillaceae bacterium]
MKKYIVREGDTLWSISKATGVRLKDLMAANPQIRDPNRLHPGDVVYIPEAGWQPPAASAAPAPTPGQTGKPQPGVAPSESAAPAAADPVPGYFGLVWPHVVRAGETWESISQAYQVDLAQLKQMNPALSERPLQEGHIVYVPSAPAHVPVQPPAPAPPGSAWQGEAAAYPPYPQGHPYGLPPGGYPATVYGPGYQPVPGTLVPGEQLPGFEPPAVTPPGAAGLQEGPHTHHPYRWMGPAAWYPRALPVPPAWPGAWPGIGYAAGAGWGWGGCAAPLYPPRPFAAAPWPAAPWPGGIWQGAGWGAWSRSAWDEWEDSSSWESSWEADGADRPVRYRADHPSFGGGEGPAAENGGGTAAANPDA